MYSHLRDGTLAATVRASSEVAGNEAAKAGDDDAASAWRTDALENQWLELDFGKPTTVNEFKIREDPSSRISRYAIECWDEQTEQWAACFNGMAIGSEFVAPIISRTTHKARLLILRTSARSPAETPAICSFEAYNDTTGAVFNDPTGELATRTVGR